MTDMLICWHLNHVNHHPLLYLLFRIPNHNHKVIELREKGLGRQGEERLESKCRAKRKIS